MLSREWFCTNSPKEQRLFSYRTKLLANVEPYYFFKLSNSLYLFLEVPIKENSDIIIKNCLYQQSSFCLYSVFHENEEVGYAIATSISIQYSGAYLIGKQKGLLPKNSTVQEIFKQGHLAVYYFEKGRFIAVSSKLSSMTESILEEQ